MCHRITKKIHKNRLVKIEKMSYDIFKLIFRQTNKKLRIWGMSDETFFILKTI